MGVYRSPVADMCALSAQRIRDFRPGTFTPKTGAPIRIRAKIQTRFVETVEQETGSTSISDMGVWAEVRMSLFPDPASVNGGTITMDGGDTWVVIDRHVADSPWLYLKLNTLVLKS